MPSTLTPSQGFFRSEDSPEFPRLLLRQQDTLASPTTKVDDIGLALSAQLGLLTTTLTRLRLKYSYPASDSSHEKAASKQVPGRGFNDKLTISQKL